jgi:type II secretory ATPase GspE/PulE/Tfp pilus assembly ATPase PilB-like protein
VKLVHDAVEKFVKTGMPGWDTQPNFREPVGCDLCLHTGFLGRIAVYELFDVDERIRQQIIERTSESETTENIRAQGVRSMAHDGFLKVWQGITTTAEVLTVGA